MPAKKQLFRLRMLHIIYAMELTIFAEFFEDHAEYLAFLVPP
jgi:hypothetical protein